MTEWIVKEKGYVPLPDEHLLRKDVDLVLLPGGKPTWLSVGTSAGESVGASAYEHACCRVEDWPDGIGPVPQEPCSEPEFRVEVGKRYVNRIGNVSGVLEHTSRLVSYHKTHPFYDRATGRTFSKCGQLLFNKESEHDLIAEYHEPAAEPAVSTEPQPGQWWVRDEDRTIIQCVGRLIDGDLVWRGNDGEIDSYGFGCFPDFYHEPRCTGFDWTPPAEPEQPSEPTASQEIIESLTKFAEELERESSKKQERTIAELRSQCERQAGTIESLQSQIESDRRWIESLYEQINELIPKPPAEDPEEWVTQDRVAYRRDVDIGCWISPDGKMLGGFSNVPLGANGKRHGDKSDCGNYRLRVLCRRKDLPPLPSPEPTKTRTIPMAVVLCSNDGECWVEARVSTRDGKPCVPDDEAEVRIVEEYTREISLGE